MKFMFILAALVGCTSGPAAEPVDTDSMVAPATTEEVVTPTLEVPAESVTVPVAPATEPVVEKFELRGEVTPRSHIECGDNTTSSSCAFCNEGNCQ